MPYSFFTKTKLLCYQHRHNDILFLVNYIYSLYYLVLTQREGFSKFNKIYEFDYNILGQVSMKCVNYCSLLPSLFYFGGRGSGDSQFTDIL